MPQRSATRRFLIAAQQHVLGARDRKFHGVRPAVAAGAQNGQLLRRRIQTPGIAKTCVLVVDAGYGFGKRTGDPGRPLRESPHRGLARADAVVLLDADAQPGCLEPRGCARTLRSCHAALRTVAGRAAVGTRLLAFAGIGAGEILYGHCWRLGAELRRHSIVPDIIHTAPASRPADPRRERCGSRLVTTAKDIVDAAANERHIEVFEVENPHTLLADPAP